MVDGNPTENDESGQSNSETRANRRFQQDPRVLERARLLEQRETEPQSQAGSPVPGLQDKVPGMPRLYSPWQTGVCGFFLGPVALGYYAQQNYLALGDTQKAKDARILGFVLGVLLILVRIMELHSILDVLVSTVVPILFGWYIVFKKQLEPIGIKEVYRYGYHSTGQAIKMGLLNFLWLLLMVLVIVIVGFISKML